MGNKCQTFLNCYGFSCVCDNQGSQHIPNFLKCLEQRVIDCRWQDWHDHIQNSDRFATHKLFKVSNEIGVDINQYAKTAFTKFRLGVTDLACHGFRYCIARCEICRLCTAAREDELHFLLCCPALTNLRNMFTHKKFFFFFFFAFPVWID